MLCVRSCAFGVLLRDLQLDQQSHKIDDQDTDRVKVFERQVGTVDDSRRHLAVHATCKTLTAATWWSAEGSPACRARSRYDRVSTLLTCLVCGCRSAEQPCMSCSAAALEPLVAMLWTTTPLSLAASLPEVPATNLGQLTLSQSSHWSQNPLPLAGSPAMQLILLTR